MNEWELTGRAQSHLVALSDPACLLHAHAARPFTRLRQAAAEAGLALKAVSGFREFDRQLAIWNGKYRGDRPALDADGRPLDVLGLTPSQRVDAILMWSALPGASRHHWGTDVDLIDAAAVPADYRVQLTPAEYAPGGPFARAAAWLDANAGRFGFFRPYRGIRSGVRPEPWHFSFAPVSDHARRALDRAVLAAALEAAPLAGKEIVLARLEELHGRYVTAIDWP